MIEIHNSVCPNCEAIRPIESGTRRETVPVRGIDIEIEAEYNRCTVCGEDFADGELMERTLQAAYDVYRARFGILSPAEIKAIRTRYGASQKAFGLILGFGELTINSYESGSLPTDANNNLLKLSRHPAAFKELLQANKEKIGPTQRKRIEDALACVELRTVHPEFVAEESPVYGCDEVQPSEFTGFAVPDKEKLFKLIAAILIIRGMQLYKTQINKLLFYVEFASFRDRTVPISGWPFAAIDYGPVPDDFQLLLAEGEKEGYFHWATDPMERGDLYAIPEGIDQKKILSSFSDAEFVTIRSVVSKLGRKTATALTELSHKERAWTETGHARRISYEWAKDLVGV